MRKLQLAMLMSFCAAQAMAEPKVYVVGVENINYLPYYQTKENVWTGMCADILDEFARSEGIKFKYESLPVSRLLADFLATKSEIDFKFPDNEMWAQDSKKGKDVAYSGVVTEYTDGVMVVPSKKGAGKSALKKLGIVRGFTAWDYMGEIKSKTIQTAENNALVPLLQTTINHRNDGAYVNVAVAKYMLSKELSSPEALVFDDGLPHTTSSYKVSTLKHKDVLVKLDAFLKKNPELIAKLKQKWQ